MIQVETMYMHQCALATTCRLESKGGSGGGSKSAGSGGI